MCIRDRPYTAMDIIARKKRMEGKNVLFPIGYDAFGLPTENYAIKNHIHPRIVTEQNIATFRRQLKALGYSFDWDREINTTDPKYCKWTQWIFLQMFRHGLALSLIHILLEALETRPDCRRRGFGKQLILSVLSHRPRGTKIYSEISKENLPSLAIHRVVGFSQVLDYGLQEDGSKADHCVTMGVTI